MKTKRLYMVDSGFVMGSPFPHFMITPQRVADIFLSFETSARDSDDGGLFKVFYSHVLMSIEALLENQYISLEVLSWSVTCAVAYIIVCVLEPSEVPASVVFLGKHLTLIVPLFTQECKKVLA